MYKTEKTLSVNTQAHFSRKWFMIRESDEQLVICAWHCWLSEAWKKRMQQRTKHWEAKYKQGGSHGICEECSKKYFN